MRSAPALLVFLGWCWLGAAAGEPAGLPLLPEPLTLEHALSLADGSHPELESARAALDGARAERQAVDADFGTRIGVELALRAVEPSDLARRAYSTNNDSWARFKASRRLYDFGAADAAREAASAAVRGGEWAYLDARQRRRLEIMARFFDVLVADLEYARDTEEMATEYVTYDKAVQRNELGRLSDIELLEADKNYQAALQRRRLSQARQRASRSRLAIALNRPEQLSAELQAPRLPDLERELGELEPLVAAALEANPRLQAERSQLHAAEDRVRAARLSYRGELRGEFEAGAYNRRFARDDPFAAGLVLELPLYTGGAKDAELAKAWAEVRERRAGIARQELELRQAVLDLWLEIGSLRARLQELDSLGRYRDLYLDRSRALYEMEVTADLGDAMVGTSDHRLQQARAEYDMALAWAHLDALTGRLLQAPDQTDPDQEATP